MTYKKVKRKLKEFYKKEKEHIIIKKGNSYFLYDIYIITNKYNLWEVIKHKQRINFFESSATALGWCLADKDKKYMLSHNLIVNDHTIQKKINNIELYKYYLELGYEKNIIRARISEDLSVIGNIRNEISNDLYKYKYIKIKSD